MRADRLLTGACLCRSVRLSVRGPVREVIVCHCTMCRRQSSHVFAYITAWREQLSLLASGGLCWYLSGPRSRRGFCQYCGSTLFFEPINSGRLCIAAGIIDSLTGHRPAAHIYAADKGAYYEIAAGEAAICPAGGAPVPMPPRPPE